MDSGERTALLQRAYQLFNDRDIDALLEMMTDDVEWPDVANSTMLHDKAAIRTYWEGQFAAADPRVSPTEFLAAGDDVVAVVEQHLADLEGRLLAPQATVFHRYAFEGDRVRRMVVFTELDEALAGS
jgi:ketosteroid isomerase-like protein